MTPKQVETCSPVTPNKLFAVLTCIFDVIVYFVKALRDDLSKIKKTSI